jgi:hypothetical protein
MGVQNVSAARRHSSFNMERKNDMGVLESTAGFGRSESIPISSQKPTRCWDLALPEALGEPMLERAIGVVYLPEAEYARQLEQV